MISNIIENSIFSVGQKYILLVKNKQTNNITIFTFWRNAA